MNQVLIIEDDPAMGLLFTEFLKSDALNIAVQKNGYDAIQHIQKNPPEVILIDLGLPDIDGIDLIKDIQAVARTAEIIIVTGEKSADIAMQAVHLGAKDYLVKPVTKERLRITVNNALERIELERKLRVLEGNAASDNKFSSLVGQSGVMQDLFKQLELCAQSEENIFMCGEEGSGKQLCAKVIHQLSEKKDQPFIVLDCHFLEKKEAQKVFLDAYKKAKSGTLFLSNVASFPYEDQNIILKHIECEAALRIIAASNKAGLEDVQEKRLREDLYYRLNILPLDIPPLRNRKEDIPLLATYFLQKYSKEQKKFFENFEESSLNILNNYFWPGNVKELKNTIKSIISLHEDEESVSISMIPKAIIKSVNETQRKTFFEVPANIFEDDTIIPIEDLEYIAIRHALKVCAGNVQEAANKLKISPATLYRKKSKL